MQVWLISCTLFVFLALMEYFIVLFSIRYDKHWRTVKAKPSPPPSNAPVSAHNAPNASLTTTQNERKNGLEQAARAFSTMNKITPETRAKFSTMAAKRREEALINEANCIPPPNNPILANRRRFVHVSISAFSIHKSIDDTSRVHVHFDSPRCRFKSVAENALLYAGSQHGKLDQISLIVFPLSFLIFTISYWIIYINESKKRIM